MNPEEIIDVEPTITPTEEKTEVNQFQELLEIIQKSEGFLLGVTTISEGKLNHYLVTNSFPHIDMLKSLVAIKELVVNRLENLK